MSKGKALCIIQARMGSTRFPGKTLMKVAGKTLLEHCLSRVKLSKRINKALVATTVNPEDDAIEVLCQSIRVECFRGSAEDVLDRYWQCARLYPDHKIIVRITGDCPLIDPVVIDRVLDFFERENVDYASNVLKETYPDGMDVEVFTRQALEMAAREATLASEREHVTLYIRNQPKFRKGNVAGLVNLSKFRLTVDEPADFEVIKFLIKHLPADVGLEDIIKLLLEHLEVAAKNMDIKRNAGLIKSLKNDFRTR